MCDKCKATLGRCEEPALFCHWADWLLIAATVAVIGWALSL